MLISGVKFPGLCLCESHFIVFPGAFKSSSKCPQRTVTNIPRNVPSHWYQSLPLKAAPCLSAAQARGLGRQPEQGYCIVIPNSFFGVGGGRERGHLVLMLVAVPIESNAR